METSRADAQARSRPDNVEKAAIAARARLALALSALAGSVIALAAMGDAAAVVRGSLCVVGLWGGQRLGVAPRKLAVTGAALLIAVWATSDLVGDILWVDTLAHLAGGGLVAWAIAGSRMTRLEALERRLGTSRAALALGAAIAVGLIWEAGEWTAAAALPGNGISAADSVRDLVADAAGALAYLAAAGRQRSSGSR